MKSPHSAIIGSVSHEAQTYGPRLIQLGITLVRGNSVPPYNYVRHRVVTSESLKTDTEHVLITATATATEKTS
jgi:ribose transport system substrate-binding protein